MACTVTQCGNGADGPLYALKPMEADPVGLFLIAQGCAATTQKGGNSTAMALLTAYLDGPMAP